MSLHKEVIERSKSINGTDFIPLKEGLKVLCDVLDERSKEQDKKIENIILRVTHHIQNDKLKELTGNKK